MGAVSVWKGEKMSAAQVKYATRLGIILLVVALMGFGTVKDIFQNLGDTMVEWTDGDGYTSRAQAQANVPQEAHIEAGVTQHFVTPDTCDFSFQKSQGVAVMINSPARLAIGEVG